MPKIESSAINDLIELVVNKPLDRDSRDELLFRAPEPAPVARPSATGTGPMAQVAPVGPVVDDATRPKERIAVAKPRPPRRDDVDATHALTRRVMRGGPQLITASIAALVLAGVGIGLAGYRLLATPSASPAKPGAVVVTAPAPTVKPVVASIVPVAPTAPALVELRLESQPAGATVMLVDRGKSSLLGTTPISASVDPSRTYDLVFTLEGRPPDLEHIDPRATQHLAIALGEPPPVAEPAPPAGQHRHHKSRSAARSTAKVGTAEHAGTGTLMVSSKPPCDIVVDGNPTGLTTPQRSIPLAAGSHRVTLVNARQHIKKTVAVTIAPNRSTKLIRDLMKR